MYIWFEEEMTILRLFELKKWQKSGLGGRAHLLHHLIFRGSNLQDFGPLLFCGSLTKSAGCDNRRFPYDNIEFSFNRVWSGRSGASNSLFLRYVFNRVQLFNPFSPKRLRIGLGTWPWRAQILCFPVIIGPGPMIQANRTSANAVSASNVPDRNLKYVFP